MAEEGRWRLIAFDWDGTLMDSTGKIVAAAMAAIDEVGLPPTPPERVKSIIGLGLAESCRALFPTTDVRPGSVLYRDFVQAYREHFFSDRFAPSELYPRVREVLESLRAAGYLMAVATGKGRRGLDMELDRTALREYFHATLTAEETRSKPHPEMLHRLMDELDVHATDTLMVGDTDFDLQMARSAGVASVAVTWGAHEAERLAASKPLDLLDAIHELPGWLADAVQVSEHPDADGA